MAVSPPPQPTVTPPQTTRLNLMREYVSATSRTTRYTSATLAALPHPIDDLSVDLGTRIYRCMARDPQVSACITILKAAILEDGITLAPAISDSASADYRVAVDIRDEAEQVLSDLETPLDDVLWDLCDAMAYGSRLAEQVYETRRGLTRDRLFQVADLAPKPTESVKYVVDATNTVLGLLPSDVPFSPDSPTSGLIPRGKFLLLPWHPVNKDPRGTSLLNAAYEPWWRKQQLIPEYLRYLAQFAGPSLWATTPEDSTPVPPVTSTGEPDPSVTPTSAQQVLLDALLQFQNSTAAAFAHGTELNLIQSSGDGSAFHSGFGMCNQEITKSILTQELATEQSDNQARAAAQVHQDVLDTLIRQGKKSIVTALRRQVLRQWVALNWGADRVHLTPIVSLGQTEEQDLPQLIRAFAAAFSAGMLARSQMPYVDRRLGLPVRDLDEEPLVPRAGRDGRPVQDGSPPSSPDGSGDDDTGPDTEPGDAPQPGQGGG